MPNSGRWIKDEGPLCPVHVVPMVRREVMAMWQCVGYDGEGCDYYCTDELAESSKTYFREVRDATRTTSNSGDGDDQSERLRSSQDGETWLGG